METKALVPVKRKDISGGNMETKALVPVKRKVLYRFVDGYDWSKTQVIMYEYPIIDETEKSYFIKTWGYERKRVLKTGKNLYAWDTEDKALFNYIKRKERQITLLSTQLKRVQDNYAYAKYLERVKEEYKEKNPTSTILEQLTLW